MDNERFQELVLEQLKALTEGQARLETRVGGLEEGQKALQQDVKSLQQGQQALEARMDNLEIGQKSLVARMDNLEDGQRSLQQNVLRIETSMEHEVIEKIRGLYDFREVQNEVNGKILAALERIEAKIESHDIQIHILDDTKANKRKAK